jgi:hypothetical protein
MNVLRLTLLPEAEAACNVIVELSFIVNIICPFWLILSALVKRSANLASVLFLQSFDPDKNGPMVTFPLGSD